MGSQHARTETLRRGGGQPVVSLDARKGEERLGQDTAGNRSPEFEYERNWALAVLDEAMESLKRHFEESGRERVFEALRPLLEDEGDRQPYDSLAQELGTTKGTVKIMVHRFRRRYREALRAVVLQTVESPADLKEELHQLLQVLQS